jgi:hypothetical protein
MVLMASRRARRAVALVVSLLSLSFVSSPSEAKPKPEPDSDDVTFTVTDPGTGKKGKGKATKPPSKKTAAKPTPKPKAAPKTAAKPTPKPKAAPKTAAKPTSKPPAKPTPQPKTAPAAKSKPEPDSDDVTLTTTTADGTKVEEIELEEEEEAEPALPEEEEAPPSRAKLNWAGLYFQQDSLIYSSVKNVCPSADASGRRIAGNPNFSCRDADSVYKSRVYSGGGNQVGGGFGLATTRLMLGYDRVFIDRVTAGARLGYAFREAPTVAGVQPSIPFHVELRGAYHLLGARPFEEGGFHPFAGLGVGLAEVDGVVAVDFYPDAAAFAAKKSSRLHAWRRTGTGFVAPTVGATYGVAGLLFTAELKPMILFPASAVSISLGLGAAYGL